MRAPSILIVHPDRKTQRTVQRILGVMGYRIDVVDDVDAARRSIAELSPVLVVFDGALDADRVRTLVSTATDRGTEACLALLTGPQVSEVPKILELGAITNLLVHPLPVLAEALTITTQKLILRDLFGVEKYLLWGTALHQTVLTRSSQRAPLVAQIGQLLRSRGQSERIASAGMLVADELMSNAVHNAPIDAAGVAYRRDTPRDADFPLDERHQVRFRWGCDARYLAVEVTDPFGSLDRETIMKALANSEIRESGTGAGMGISLAYRSCDHLVFNLAPGKRTEVIALIDIRYPPLERPVHSGSTTSRVTPASSYNIFVERT
ncbi:MAG: hypothetical protein AB7P03_19135 [Kofleriaceae bacterium]